MSREIKFRAWNKKGKCWITFGGVNYRYENGILDIVDNDNLIYEQYTGLKDKNGKEIYEGDIVDDGFSRNCKIRWSEHFTAFEAVNEDDGYMTNIWFVSKYGEVIGNIHENPQLLGGEE